MIGSKTRRKGVTKKMSTKGKGGGKEGRGIRKITLPALHIG